MHADEQADAAVGGGAGQDGQHRKQQQGGKAVTLSLAAARIGDLFQGGEQAGERHHGGLRCEGLALNSSAGRLVPQPQTPPSQTAYVENRTALCVVSRAVAMVDATMALFAFYHCNGGEFRPALVG